MRGKTARWGRGVVYVPDDARTLGFLGPRSDIDAARVGDLVTRANDLLRRQSHVVFVKVGAALRSMGSDADPGMSRAALIIAFQDIFLNLADDSHDFFKKLP